MFQFAEKPLSGFQIYKQSFVLYKHTFSKVWYVILANLAIINFVQFFAPRANLSSTTVSSISSLSKAHVGAAGVYPLIALILSLYFIAVAVHRIYRLAISPTDLLISSYIVVLRKIIFIALTSMIILILVSVGFVAAWIPGIFLMFLMSLSLAAILFEEKKVFSAIKRSCQLVWGNWWHTFSVFVPIIIVGLSFFVAMLFVFQATNLAWLVAMALLIFSVIASPLFFSIYLVQYNDLKLRKAQEEIVI